MTQEYQILCENNYAFKSYDSFRKKLENATEQHYKGNKTNKNDGTELERALNSLNLDYFIHYSSFCDEDERPMPDNRHLLATCSCVLCHQTNRTPNRSA